MLPNLHCLKFWWRSQNDDRAAKRVSQHPRRRMIKTLWRNYWFLNGRINNRIIKRSKKGGLLILKWEKTLLLFRNRSPDVSFIGWWGFVLGSRHKNTTGQCEANSGGRRQWWAGETASGSPTLLHTAHWAVRRAFPWAARLQIADQFQNRWWPYTSHFIYALAWQSSCTGKEPCGWNHLQYCVWPSEQLKILLLLEK